MAAIPADDRGTGAGSGTDRIAVPLRFRERLNSDAGLSEHLIGLV